MCEELNFHSAARRIGIAQPAISRAVADLERRLGARLLERSTRAVTLTEAGRGFQDDARALLAEAERTAHNARLTAGGIRGRLRVANVEFAAQRLLPAVVRRFQASEPDIALDFCAMSSERQRRALGERDIDMGFMLGPYGGSGLASAGVAEEPLVALLPRDHALARQASVTWRAIDDGAQGAHHDPVTGAGRTRPGRRLLRRGAGALRPARHRGAAGGAGHGPVQTCMVAARAPTDCLAPGARRLAGGPGTGGGAGVRAGRYAGVG